MIWFAFAPALAAGLTLQTPYGALDATPETYQPPVVRPFEPPSDFGREQAQGDSGDAAHRRALTQPVVVGAYVGSYETSPSDAETAYDQGVAQAEITMDSRAGPLDGRWRVLDAEGRPLMSLALTDLGGGRRIEGAWRRLDPRVGRDDGGVAGPARTDGATTVVPVGTGALRLHASDKGWTGVLVQGGQRRPVTVARPG
ncbi:MAG: hypothetical protein K5831_07540 [Brevundimonas sp.]|uniref:Secreted protein n=1 Tax=Brevundimonas albigilva TaxID=1312364 RepID=A0ABY4SLN1_9CAUL|nr:MULTISPECIES: hypothetical protein [Brevundimonas]MCV0414722.1 hypothetical protein [Brevundimonas sp.]URI15179.1 hypothetical protein M8231_15540 [Brevundimonas albigilva]